MFILQLGVLRPCLPRGGCHGDRFPVLRGAEIFDPLNIHQSTLDNSAIGEVSADVMTPYVSEDREFREGYIIGQLHL